MFKVPAWEKDTPISEVKFGKKINNKQNTSTKNAEPAKKDRTNHNNKVHPNGVNKVFPRKHKNEGNIHNSHKFIPQSGYSSKIPNSSNLSSKSRLVNGINKTHTKKHKFKGKNTNVINKKRSETSLPLTNSATNAINKKRSETSLPLTNSATNVINNKRSETSLPLTNSAIDIINKKKSETSLPLRTSATNILKTLKKKKKIESNHIDTNIAPVNGIDKTQSKKRKHDAVTVNTNKNEETDFDNTFELPNFDSDLLDEVIINVKKKKLNDEFKNDDKEEDLFGDRCKKERIRKLLQKSNRNPINVGGNKLRDRMMERLKAAQFRYLNEKLYTSSGSDAQKLFQNDPVAFQTYHEGYQQQVKKWPVNPLDVIVKRIQKMPKSHTIADMGCGEAALSRRVPHSVRSFDLVGAAPGVEPCDMAHTPLLTGSVDATVYCLALMGTDLTRYLLEANRVLKIGGHLLIAEVESRFDRVENFTKEVERLGFKLKNLDKSNEVFFFIEFTKIRDSPVKKSKLPTLSLKPCLYKKR